MAAQSVRRQINWDTRGLLLTEDLAQNIDVATAVGTGVFQSTYQHYMAHGAIEGRAASEFFDTEKYREANPDVAQAGVNALEHYLAYGINEGRTGFLADTFMM